MNKRLKKFDKPYQGSLVKELARRSVLAEEKIGLAQRKMLVSRLKNRLGLTLGEANMLFPLTVWFSKFAERKNLSLSEKEKLRLWSVVKRSLKKDLSAYTFEGKERIIKTGLKTVLATLSVLWDDSITDKQQRLTTMELAIEKDLPAAIWHDKEFLNNIEDLKESIFSKNRMDDIELAFKAGLKIGINLGKKKQDLN